MIDANETRKMEIEAARERFERTGQFKTYRLGPTITRDISESEGIELDMAVERDQEIRANRAYTRDARQQLVRDFR